MAKSDPLDLTKYRNLGVIAHIDAGKTTTTEHLLFYAGVKYKLGGVDTGNTETDYDPEEQERGITIYSACIPFSWNGHTVNLIDTPGHVDFTAEVERSLRVLDGAICVFDGQKGVEAQSETVWKQADKYAVPRMIFINKMDVVGANFAATLGTIHDRLTPHFDEHGRPVPIVIPIGAGSVKDSPKPFGGVIDLIEQKAIYFDADDLGKTFRIEEIPEEEAGEAAKWREQMFDALTAHDDTDTITSVLLNGQEPAIAEVRALIRKLTLARTIYPVLCGSGREHIGIQPLLDAVTHYLPSPLDRPAVVGVNPKNRDREERRKPDIKEPFCGLVFKAAWHPSGHRFFIRVYSGILRPNSRAFNTGKDVKENIAKLFHVHADPNRGLEEVESAPAGDIVAVVGLKESVTGDTLCDTQHPILLEAISFAESVVSQSIEPESGNDKDKLAGALLMLQLEDPTFKVAESKDTGQTLMSGMGTLHLEVKKHRLERDFKLKVRVSKPRVSYREKLRAGKVVEVTVDRLGEKPTFAQLRVSFTNFPVDRPVVVKNAIPGDALPNAFAAAAERGLADACQTGEFGYPIMHLQATLLDAKFDPTLSVEDAYVVAAAKAFRQACEGNLDLMEPIMKVTVTTPAEFLGNITGDLAKRGGQIEETKGDSAAEVIAKVPLEKLFTYANEVRSLSQGRANVAMEPFSYEVAPPDVVKRIRG